VLGGLLCAAALAACVTAGSFFFPLATLAVAAVGVSTYAFLYIRSGLQPLLDEADPETWHNLLAVIRREQYGSRGPLDNPILPPGEANPGRTLTLFAQQLVNFGQYFVWQWGRGWGIIVALPAVLFTALGTLGFDEARRRDRGIAWLLGTLWLVTGLGLVVYMNFKPGFSLFWDQYPKFDQHEVRERDYFFTVSFQVWGLLAGVGLARAFAWWRTLVGGRWATGAAAAVALLPFVLNFSTASRRHGADATAARDFAYNLLQSVEPYGILFSYGDNDTFPVWYLQEVEGVRQDVTLINLSLAALDWYVRQIVSRPTRPFDSGRAPAAYRALAPPGPPGPPLRLTREEIDQLQPVRVGEGNIFSAGGLQLPIPAGKIFQVRDLVILYTLAASLPARSVSFGVNSGRGSWLGLDPHLVLEGLAYRVFPGRPDTVKRYVAGIQGTMVDPRRTTLLVDSVFHFGRLLEADVAALDPAARQVATSFSIPFLELGNAAALRRDKAETLARFRRAERLNPSAQLSEIIGRVEREGVERLFQP
jgi:hypothetical protein